MRACPVPHGASLSLSVLYLRRAILWEGRGATLGLPSMVGGYLSKGFYLCARAAFFSLLTPCVHRARRTDCVAVHVYAKYPIRSGVYLGDESICPGEKWARLTHLAADSRSLPAYLSSRSLSSVVSFLWRHCHCCWLCAAPLQLVSVGSPRRLWWYSAATTPPHRPVAAHVFLLAPHLR